MVCDLYCMVSAAIVFLTRCVRFSSIPFQDLSLSVPQCLFCDSCPASPELLRTLPRTGSFPPSISLLAMFPPKRTHGSLRARSYIQKHL